jgi:hypothetical protein
MRGRDKTQRGLGPFTGGQFTAVIIAICAAIVVGAPVAALAAGGVFTNNNATVPAVKATNSNAHGIGVQGTGKKYGVYSNGPLGVAAGKPLSCNGCVGFGALQHGLVRNPPTAVDDHESVVLDASDQLVASVNVTPLGGNGDAVVTWTVDSFEENGGAVACFATTEGGTNLPTRRAGGFDGVGYLTLSWTGVVPISGEVFVYLFCNGGAPGLSADADLSAVLVPSASN